MQRICLFVAGMLVVFLCGCSASAPKQEEKPRAANGLSYSTWDAWGREHMNYRPFDDPATDEDDEYEQEWTDANGWKHRYYRRRSSQRTEERHYERRFRSFED